MSTPLPKPQYDYTHQAWVENGVYIRCGHPESMDCGCYGRAHAGEPVNHQQDSDCDVDAYGDCILCGVHHGDPCVECHGKGFHTADCFEQQRPQDYEEQEMDDTVHECPNCERPQQFPGLCATCTRDMHANPNDPFWQKLAKAGQL